MVARASRWAPLRSTPRADAPESEGWNERASLIDSPAPQPRSIMSYAFMRVCYHAILMIDGKSKLATGTKHEHAWHLVSCGRRWEGATTAQLPSEMCEPDVSVYVCDCGAERVRYSLKRRRWDGDIERVEQELFRAYDWQARNEDDHRLEEQIERTATEKK